MSKTKKKLKNNKNNEIKQIFYYIINIDFKVLEMVNYKIHIKNDFL